jgi:hypothetical protein
MNQSSSSSQKETQLEKPLEELLNMYIENMNIYEKVAYEIAKNNLESSYDMEKSIGFIDFLKKNNYTIHQ